MAISLLDLILVLLWPVVMSAAAWAIAIRALREADEISAVVQALTRSKAADKAAPLHVSHRRTKLPANLRPADTAACPSGIQTLEIEQ